MNIRPATRLHYSAKNKARIMVRRNICHRATKTGRGIVFPRSLSPGNGRTKTVETLHCKRKMNSADKRGEEEENKREQTSIRSSESIPVLRPSVPLFICSPLPAGHEMVQGLDQQSNKTCSTIHTT